MTGQARGGGGVKPYWTDGQTTLHLGDVRDVLRSLPEASVQCAITSPPYWSLRDYGIEPSVWGDGWIGALGLEPTPDAFVAHIVEVFRELRRVLKPDGVLWLNLGDSYANDTKWGGATGGKHVTALHGDSSIGRRRTSTGLKPKDRLLMPARCALALQADGWWLRSEITWCKGNPMPESVTDRPTNATERIYLLTKSDRYFYDAGAIRVPTATANFLHRSDESLSREGSAAPLGFATQGGKVSRLYEFAPYLALATLLTAKGIFGEEWHRDFHQFLDALKAPQGDGAGGNRAEFEAPTEHAMHVAKYLGVVVPHLDLEPEPKFLAMPAVLGPQAVKDVEAPFTVEEAREVVAEVVRYAQAIRKAFTRDALTERLIDIDVVAQAVPLFDGPDALAGQGGDRCVAQAFLKEFALTLENGRISHQAPPSSNNTIVGKDTRNAWDWWVINSEPFPEAHFATFPTALVKPMVLAGSREGDVVLDPFVGSGTTPMVAKALGRPGWGIDMNREYLEMAKRRCAQMALMEEAAS